MKNKDSKLKNYLLKLIYPNNIKCIFCGDELNQNEHNDSCENCLEILPYIEYYCDKCGLPVHPEELGVCLRCKNNNYHFEMARSVFVYNNMIVKAVHGFKYSNRKYLAKSFAKYMAEYYGGLNLFADFVTFVPMFETKEKARGYNQAKLLAEEFCKLVKLPCVDCCVKTVENVSQTTLSFKERNENIKDSFAFKPEFKKEVRGKTILLIDDIFTTGATSNEVCKVLKENGAKACYVLTIAHTVIEDIKDN